jgi:hypothetical protein
MDSRARHARRQANADIGGHPGDQQDRRPINVAAARAVDSGEKMARRLAADRERYLHRRPTPGDANRRDRMPISVSTQKRED